MKKLLLLIISGLVLSACGTTDKGPSVDRINGIVEISYQDLIKKIESGDDFILYIGREDCSTCQTFYTYYKPYLEANKDRGIYYFNTKSLRDASRKDNATQEDITAYENVRETLHFNWTPTFHHIKDKTFASTFTYLDASYYETSDASVKEAMYQIANEDFQLWYDALYKEVK